MPATRSHPVPSLAEDSLALALQLAAGVIAHVIRGRNLDVALAAASLPARARPAVMDLAYGALREFARGDALIRPLLQSPLKEPSIRGLLLAALHRLEQRPADVHTTVDQAVSAAAGLAGGKFRPLVNAVLRNYLRQKDALETTALSSDEARWQHPGWWIAALRKDWPDNYEEILAAGNSHPPMALRVNMRRSSVSEYAELLAGAGIPARAINESGLLLERPVAVDRLPGFFEGFASVQDDGAQWAARLLGAQPGMRVLDACAAPGGKTAHLLELADVALVALDAESKRASRITENLNRLGLNALVRTADCRQTAAWWDGTPFDRILADVPCSASGVVRRHPDAKWLRRPTDVASFAATQAEILDALWPLLTPGGRMLYCTCSVFRQENDRQMTAFCQRHPDVLRIPTAPSGEVDFHLQPGPAHDGFYYALLEKAL